MDDASWTRRNCSRFSLRTFFIALTVFLVWLGYNVQRAERQRAACERIERLDGYVDGHITYTADWDMDAPGLPRRKSASIVNRWMRSVVGNDFLQPVAFIAAPGATNDLSIIETFSDLKALTLEQSDVTDDSIKQITHLQELRYLWLDNTQISDGAVEYIWQLRNLRELYIRQTNITAEGESQLKARLPDCNIYLKGR